MVHVVVGGRRLTRLRLIPVLPSHANRRKINRQSSMGGLNA
jgi:hypothetical protein